VSKCGKDWHLIFGLDILKLEENYTDCASRIIGFFNAGPWSVIKPKMGEVNVAEVLVTAKDAGRLYRVPGADYKISVLQPMPKGSHCEEMERAFPEIDWATLQRASDKEERQKSVKLVKMAKEKLPSQTELDLTPDDLLDMLWLQCLLTAETDGEGRLLMYPPVEEDLLHTVALHDTSPGFQDHTFPGNSKAVSKREQHVETIIQFLIHEHTGVPPMTVDKPSPKKETTNGPGKDDTLKSKDLRYIMAANTLEIFTNGATGLTEMMSKPTNPHKGTSIEVTHGFYEYVVYAITQLEDPELSFEERCALVEREGLTKIDYSGWEINVGLLPKLVCAISYVGRLSDKGMTYRHCLIGALAAYLCPLIGIKGEYVLSMPDCVSSGKTETLCGNGDCQRLAASRVILQGGYSRLDIHKVLAALVQGDDFVSLALDEEERFVKELSEQFGMQAVPEGAGTADFLQRKLIHSRKAAVMDTVRAIKKVYHNDSSEKAAEQAASLRFQCNAMEGSEEHDMWEKLAQILPVPELVGVENLAHDQVITLSGAVVSDQGLINLQHRHKDYGAIMMMHAVGNLTNTSLAILRERNDIAASREKSIALAEKRGVKLI